MKHIYSFLLIICCIGLSQEVFAQNPRRTQKMAAEAKRRAAQSSDTKREFVPHDKDSDKDGVLDINDKCPYLGERGKVTPFGCPMDSDFDGVYDSEDACVDAPGPRANHGCPWADTDGDGVLDKDDECITVQGKPEFHGCPDQDEDGIPDLLDNCPKEKGTWALKGCPPADTDKDGIPDVDDLCPKTAGVTELRGCPPLKPEEKEALKRAFDNLLFETGSDVIVESSFPSLNDLAKVMMNNPAVNLRLEGHTDDVGDDDANMLLSRKRAAAVEKYLEDRSIPAKRITSEGFGETRPKLPNTGDGNRRVNRRVEMILQYE
ncbi:MAG: OmpA family protein [Bacteroidota bacterium]|nr:OmpA family protein [Bacteroidota bacterium]